MDGPGDLTCAQRFWPVLFVPDPARSAPPSFSVFATVPALLRFLDDSAGFCWSWPDGLSDRYRGPVSALMEGLRDWVDTFGDEENSVQARQDIARALARHLEDLTGGGLAVAARERFVLLTGGQDRDPLPWRVIDVEVVVAVPDLAGLSVIERRSGRRDHSR